jgi:hypothetical protein
VIEHLKSGDNRKRWVWWKKGLHPVEGGAVVLSRGAWVQVTEKFCGYTRKWELYVYDLASVTETNPEPKLSWWRRLFGARIPTARVVSG